MDIIIIALLVAILVLMVVLVVKNNALSGLRDELEDEIREVNQANMQAIKSMSEFLNVNQQNSADALWDKLQLMDRNLSQKQDEIRKGAFEASLSQEKRFQTFTLENEQRLESIRGTVDTALNQIRNDNNARLEQMRQTVDEKLQKTLDSKINDSFQLVNSRLEQVYKGLGEMQSLASGVGDLKKVLTNVKTRGILGEISLGAILSQVMSESQYDTNVAVNPASKEVVEFAVKIPNEDEGFIYLPIDAKFPNDLYSRLVDAYENEDKEAQEQAAKALMARFRQEARDISTKYISPPSTTEFAIMFLPTEGLYAEAVNRGALESLQSQYHVIIAGPSTMAALLNSLQMGFKTFAIQKRSSEVWRVLGSVKSEFDKFEAVLNAARQRLEQTDKELEKLVGTRTRQIQKNLSAVTALESFDESINTDNEQ